MQSRSLMLSLLLLGACTEGGGKDTDTDTDVIEAPPGALRAGFARRRIPAPVGIGTAGYGPTGAPKNPSPFSSIYPGTKRIHGHPELKAVALSRGPGHEVVFLRVDAVGMFSQLRNDIVARAGKALGRGLDDVVVIGATHTHSGPGSVVNTGSSGSSFFDIIADKFNPAFYERFVQAGADAVVEALTDMAPARVGFGETTCEGGHSDRRCDDGNDPYTNDRVPFVAVERDGSLDAIVLAYAVHGTMMGIGDLHLSQDVHGAIEEALEDRYDHPVDVLVLNSWGADMSPGSPQGVPTQPSASLGDFTGDYTRLREIGWVMAEAVSAAVAQVDFVDEPTIDLETHRMRIDREVIGYPDDIFESYPYGGVYCSSDNECGLPRFPDYVPTVKEDLDDKCVPFPEAFPAPSQTSTTVGRVGDFLLLTWPGEPGTLLAEELMAMVQAADDSGSPVFFVGYGQDYLGYSILEEDWWHGGYEASGALWGPRQGEYLLETIARKVDIWAGRARKEEEPARLEPFPYSLDDAWQPETALQANTVLTEVQGSYGPSDAISFEVAGQDPWLGAPLAMVVTEDGTPVLRANGQPIDSDTYTFDVELSVDPPWAKDTVDNPDGSKTTTFVRADRTFGWRFRLPVQPPVPGTAALTPGRYRIDVSVPQPTGDPVVVSSAAFEVTGS
ncbi:MAG: neutral/alkaline non-lysosomal ceramidase N-terminal domain-containing protein [Alphaproteobacteria bacterium]|nr:neutral/alkaline non-lysosomal ceramidase N-terminal domain-containing protein [Alphaproteobacteria bacterium]